MSSLGRTSLPHTADTSRTLRLPEYLYQAAIVVFIALLVWTAA